ncbi:siderophore ABC transporter substrate-binding protein [Moraxella sp.]|uniref:siderophore ABC transporter substrate-binding protein n=1 Tax=Moraxella sp. TaxID=479 RepID=UPI00262C073F|nr:ABC transporter substrate-binding protein [Moraxella sp.]
MKITQMTRPVSLGVIAALSLSLMACNQDKPADTKTEAPAANADQKAETAADNAAPTTGDVTIKTATGEQTIPANPNPIAVYDMTALQNLKALGVAVQGVPFAEMNAETVQKIDLKADGTPDGTSVGTLFEPSLEALHGLKPQAVFIGSRMAEKAEELGKIAPTYNLTIDTNNVYESSKQQITDFGKVFGKTAEADKLIADIDAAIAETKKAVEGKGNGLAILINGNKMSAYGKNSRYGYLHTTFGIPMADENIQEARHGQPISFEYLQKVDPDWLFVLDRTSAIGEEGVSAQEVLNNPLMHNTKAYKNNQIVYVSPDSYLAFGGYYQWLKDTKIVTDAFNNAKPAQ